MGILSRFFTVIRANMNSALNRAEDPTKLLEQTLLDMDSAYGKAKDQVARSVADEKRLEKSLADQKKQADKWGQRAVQAVEKGDDELAKEALSRKGEHSRIALQFEHELGAHTQNVESLKDHLHELQGKIAEVRRKKSLLISKQKRAQAQDQIYKTVEGIQDSGALDTIDRMEDMPSVAANALPIAFGDWKQAYTIVDRAGVRVLRDPYSSKPFVLFYTTKRVGGDVTDFEAMVIQKIAA